MAYQAHHGPGTVNTAYFDKGSDDSPFEHYKDSQYDKEDNPGADYNQLEEEESKKQEEGQERTLMDNIKEEEDKLKHHKKDDVEAPVRKLAEELRQENTHVKNKPDAPKKSKAHKSIEEAIKDASKEKKEVFVLE